ncbi:MAG: CFI-box-CTERM domain-containing protein [Bdellovibrionia bacterium]
MESRNKESKIPTELEKALNKKILSQSVRKRVEEEQIRLEQERQSKLLAMRIEIARAGMAAFERREMNDAVKNFFLYLKILEKTKKIPEGTLSPEHFDKSTEAVEMLTVSSIYWDLVRLFDKGTSAEKNKEFLKFMEKYLLFSKGMPYESMCAEAVRKYLEKDKAVHKDAFRNAYKVLGGKTRCFVVTSLVDVIEFETLSTLRQFRDQVLRESPRGRRFIVWYYQHGKHLAQLLDRSPRFIRVLTARLLNALAGVIRWYQ